MLVPAQRDEAQRDMKLEDRITITPGVRGGKPCIRGTRITVYDILEYLAGGMTESQILADFPGLRNVSMILRHRVSEFSVAPHHSDPPTSAG